MPVQHAEGWRFTAAAASADRAMRAGRVPRMPRWLRQPRHGSRVWYCPFTLASGSDPRHESRVAILARRRRRVEDALDVGEDQRADLPHARIAVAPRVEHTPGGVEVAHLQATRAARRDDSDRTARLVEAEC